MTSLQIRDMPDELHRRLKARAAQRGQSLAEYTTEILRRAAETPTLAELSDRIRVRGSAGTPSAEAVNQILCADRASH